MRLILLASFFNQHQKFFIARRAKQRRRDHATPAQVLPGRDKGLQFLKHSFMDGRVANHTRASVRFRSAGFELRFKERDDFTSWPD